MPIWKRKHKIEKTGYKCEACALKGVDVDLQLVDLKDVDIDYVLEKIDWESIKSFPFNYLKQSDKLRFMMIGIDRGVYNIYSCYVCGFFRMVKNR